MTPLYRAFLAITPPEAVLDAIDGLLDRSTDRRFAWTARDQWHVTLQFYGQVVDAEALTGALLPTLAEIEAVTLRLRGAGAFPKPAKADVFWLGLETSIELVRLYEAVKDASGAFVGGRDRVAFRPHLTLAMMRRATDLRPDVEVLEGIAVGPQWLASEVVLIESETGSKGAVHTEVSRIPLRLPK